MSLGLIATRGAGAALVVLMLAGGCSSSTELIEQQATAATAVPTASPDTEPLAPEPTSQARPEATPAPEPESQPHANPADAIYKSGAQIMLQTPERLAGLRVGLIANQASQVDGRPLVDLLHEHPDIDLVAVFAPEHGIRGDLGAGEQVPGGIDPATGVTVHSLYGQTRAPTADMLADIDVLLYDLQDVGTRYYTFISTMGFAMQAAAINDVAFVVLDRPMTSPVLKSSGFARDDDHVSFVGAYEIPSSYALTSAELALAIKHHPYIPDLENLDFSAYPVSGWRPGDTWPATETWVPPSPGIPTLAAAQTYPATVLFEATSVSFGRGTNEPFGQIGAPWIDAERLASELNEQALAGVRFEATTFTPLASPTTASPQFEGQVVPGVRLVVEQPSLFSATATGIYLLEAVKRQADEQERTLIERADFFDLLAGTMQLRESLESDISARTIVQSWHAETSSFDEAMDPWKLYPRPL